MSNPIPAARDSVESIKLAAKQLAYDVSRNLDGHMIREAAAVTDATAAHSFRGLLTTMTSGIRNRDSFNALVDTDIQRTYTSEAVRTITPSQVIQMYAYVDEGSYCLNYAASYALKGGRDTRDAVVLAFQVLPALEDAWWSFKVLCHRIIKYMSTVDSVFQHNAYLTLAIDYMARNSRWYARWMGKHSDEPVPKHLRRDLGTLIFYGGRKHNPLLSHVKLLPNGTLPAIHDDEGAATFGRKRHARDHHDNPSPASSEDNVSSLPRKRHVPSKDDTDDDDVDAADNDADV
jgi:hypothetical protein